MKAKEYLRQLQKLDISINSKLKEVSDLRKMSTCIKSFDYTKDPVLSSKSNNANFVTTIEKIENLENIINAEIDIFVDKKHHIINQINSLDNVTYCNILFKRYVEFKKFEVIAVEMNYTYEWIRHTHGRALHCFECKFFNN